MSYLVTVARPARIHQGLAAPVRATRGLEPVERPSAPGRQIRLVAGITFDDYDLTARGIFVDTDTVEQCLEQEVTRLESAPWTQIFSFRPSMELVSRDVFYRLQARIDNLGYVELDDLQIGASTRYIPSPTASSPPRL